LIRSSYEYRQIRRRENERVSQTGKRTQDFEPGLPIEFINGLGAKEKRRPIGFLEEKKLNTTHFCFSLNSIFFCLFVSSHKSHKSLNRRQSRQPERQLSHASSALIAIVRIIELGRS